MGKRTLPLFMLIVLSVSGTALSETIDHPAPPAQESSRSVPTIGWQALLDRAEPLYAAGNYRGAIPLYKQAADLAGATNVVPAGQVRCLRYLADCYCRLNQPDKALALFERVSSLLSPDDLDNRITNINEQALCLGLKGDYAKAESLCQAALKSCTDGRPENFWQLARTKAHLGYFDYMRAKYVEAISWFQQADQALDTNARSDMAATSIRQKLAFALAGSYYHLKRFEEACTQFKRLYDYDVSLFGKADLQTGWAMLALSDVLEKTGHQPQAEDWDRKAIYVFRKFNRDRLCREFASQSTAQVDVQDRITRYVFGSSKTPSDLQDTEQPPCTDSSRLLNTHDPRSMYARPFIDAPGRVWLNPMVPQKGIVIAIHGLSLQHSSYDAFARQLADNGYHTVAFDVRGFGSYRQALGAEQLDLDSCMSDLKLMVTAIKDDHPNVPLFILGESMGGAIALQFAAQYPQLVDGLIASVPAGKRFGEKRTDAKVAIHYLEDKNRPFDIGTDVINLATHDPRVKHAWAEDPLTRSRLSPHELLVFRSFFKRNLEYAKQIRHTPVVIYQGVCDELVKPEATYDLFRAITYRDKSLVMVGNTEHLIFEEGCFTPAVLKGLVAWMETHAKGARG